MLGNDPGDLCAIPGHVMPKILKWYLIPPCLTLSNIRYVWRVKWSNLGNGVAPSSTPRCSSYWKGSLLVALGDGRQLYLYIYGGFRGVSEMDIATRVQIRDEGFCISHSANTLGKSTNLIILTLIIVGQIMRFNRSWRRNTLYSNLLNSA